MRVYLLTDLEGVAGIDQWDSPEYRTIEAAMHKEKMVELLVGEVNAAVTGALAAGASEILINDGHGKGRNLPPDRIHAAARLIRGTGRPTWLPGLNESIGALLFIGQHAREGARGAVLAHSWSHRRRRRCFLNGQEIGEIGAAIYLAASYHVPTVFLSGDQAATEEARNLVPEMECVSVKVGLAEQAAIHVSPEQARREIGGKVELALRRRNQIPVRPLSGPFVFRQVFLTAPFGGIPLAMARVFGPGTTRALLHLMGCSREESVVVRATNHRTLEYRGDSLVAVLEYV